MSSVIYFGDVDLRQQLYEIWKQTQWDVIALTCVSSFLEEKQFIHQKQYELLMANYLFFGGRTQF